MFSNKISNLLDDLKNDNSSGANELINNAIEIIKQQLDFVENPSKDITNTILELSKLIIDSRASMAPLANTIGYLIGDLNIITKKLLLGKIKQFEIQRQIQQEHLKRNFQLFLRSMKKLDLRIMLISYSSTIIKLFSCLKNFKIEFFILESRPLLEGQKTAKILSEYFKTHLIIDAALGKFIKNIDIVLIGIDSILKDGSIINKIGSYPLSVLAYENDIDVYAIGDSFKYNIKSHYGDHPLIEAKPEEEVYHKSIANQNITVQNYYFDITPPKYIKKIISDFGVFRINKFLKKVRKKLALGWYINFNKL